MSQIRDMQQGDVLWRSGRLFAQIYHWEDELERVVEEAYLTCFPLNALSRGTFPSLARMEQEVIEMTGNLLGSGEAVGNLTSGGSESNFLAVKTARDRALARNHRIRQPELVIPSSAHPSFTKAAHYLGMKVVRVPVDADQRADVALMSDAISADTVLLVGSAPSWPHGALDPIQDLGRIALDHDLMLHVDGCVGGFVLPFARKLGREVPPFDLSVSGVTSISADLHKFGYSAKGASLVLYRDPEIYSFQPFEFDDWTGGKYSVATFVASRPGGAVSAAWAVMNYLGEPGYLEMTRRCLEATSRFMTGIESITGLFVVGKPQYNLFAFGSMQADIRAIWTGMRHHGWMIGLQGKPPSSVHLTIMPSHDRVADEFVGHLREVVDAVVRGEVTAEGAVARYN